jgi:hypothetical protein
VRLGILSQENYSLADTIELLDRISPVRLESLTDKVLLAH